MVEKENKDDLFTKAMSLMAALEEALPKCLKWAKWPLRVILVVLVIVPSVFLSIALSS